MPSSPSIVPEIDRDVCLVLDDFGPTLGRAWRETDVHDANFESVIADLLDGEYTNPICVIAFIRTRAHLTTFLKSWQLRCAHAANIRGVSCQNPCSTSWSVTRGQRREPALR